MAACSMLYPTDAFFRASASIEGLVLDVDGVTPLQGVNVIARNPEDPFGDAVSFVSGALFPPGPGGGLDPGDPRLGAYRIAGLSPLAPYHVLIEEVSSGFTGGSKVGPLAPPLELDLTEPAAFLEFWSGVNESAEDPPDDPLLAEELRMGPGSTAQRIDFVFNGVRPRVRSIEPTSGSYLLTQLVELRGANFAGARSVLLSGKAAVTSTSLEVVSKAILRARIPQGAIPGRYTVQVTTARGSSAETSVEYTVTEPLPILRSVEPAVVSNGEVSVLVLEGKHLLGIQAARLEREGLPGVTLEVVQPDGVSRALVEAPAGLLPGRYGVSVSNTTGSSAAGSVTLEVVELAPSLSGSIEPPKAVNRSPRTVRILGSNLAGTQEVLLVLEDQAYSLAIAATSLSEVQASVPSGLPPGTYLVKVVNSQGSAVGPTVFVVKGSSGGGGGCSASFTVSGSFLDTLLLALALLAPALSRWSCWRWRPGFGSGLQGSLQRP